MPRESSRLFASPASLFTGLLDAGRSPWDLNWRPGSCSEPGRWFVADDCDANREVVVDRRGWPEEAELLPRLLAFAEDEWRAGAPLPQSWLREEWARLSAARLEDAALQRLLPLVPRLREQPLSARDVGRAFAIAMQHPVAGVSLPMSVPIAPAEAPILGDAAALADARLRLRVLDVETDAVRRFVAAGWVSPGTGSVRAPGAAGQAVLDLLPHRWLEVEVELVPVDRRLVLGEVVLSESAVVAADPSRSWA